jgi:hypothetical protein
MTMKTRIGLAILAVALAAPWTPALAHEGHEHAKEEKAADGHSGHDHGEAGKAAEGQKVTVTGEVLDLSCYLGHDSKGKDHQKCAKACLLEKHVSAGLLTDDGKVFALVSDHKYEKAFAAVGQLAAEKVKVTGKKIEKGGLQAILVQSVAKE